MAGPDATNWSPVGSSERYAVLDLMRGFALFGVMLVNLLYFFRIHLFQHVANFHSHPGWLNHAIDLFVAEFVEFKAFDLFTLAFGVGIAVQAERAARREVSAEAFLIRRLLILLAFGACHMVLVSNVDILALYAICGLLAIPLLRLPRPAVALAGIAFIYLPSVFRGWPTLPPQALWPAHVANATRIYSAGSFGAILEFRWRETQQFIFPLLVGVAQKTFGLMLLGVAVWRTGVIQDPRRYRSRLVAVGLAAGIIGILNTTTDVLTQSSVPAVELLGSHVPLALAYAAVLLAWRRDEKAGAIVTTVAAAGRMALTNYLMQSILFALLFYGYGFGLFGRLEPQSATVIGVTVYASQVLFSVWWLKQFRFGPFEWLWRSLTYRQWQRMRMEVED